MANKTPAKKIAAVDARQKSPIEVAKRVARNRARRHDIKKGLVHVGDGKEVNHVTPLDGGGPATDANTDVVSAKYNKQWRKRDPSLYGNGSKVKVKR